MIAICSAVTHALKFAVNSNFSASFLGKIVKFYYLGQNWDSIIIVAINTTQFHALRETFLVPPCTFYHPCSLHRLYFIQIEKKRPKSLFRTAVEARTYDAWEKTQTVCDLDRSEATGTRCACATTSAYSLWTKLLNQSSLFTGRNIYPPRMSILPNSARSQTQPDKRCDLLNYLSIRNFIMISTQEQTAAAMQHTIPLPTIRPTQANRILMEGHPTSFGDPLHVNFVPP